jgi:hypothetical protein
MAWQTQTFIYTRSPDKVGRDKEKNKNGTRFVSLYLTRLNLTKLYLIIYFNKIHNHKINYKIKLNFI